MSEPLFGGYRPIQRQLFQKAKRVASAYLNTRYTSGVNQVPTSRYPEWQTLQISLLPLHVWVRFGESYPSEVEAESIDGFKRVGVIQQ